MVLMLNYQNTMDLFEKIKTVGQVGWDLNLSIPQCKFCEDEKLFSGGGGMGDIYSEEGDPDSLRLFPEVSTKPIITITKPIITIIIVSMVMMIIIVSTVTMITIQRAGQRFSEVVPQFEESGITEQKR